MFRFPEVQSNADDFMASMQPLARDENFSGDAHSAGTVDRPIIRCTCDKVSRDKQNPKLRVPVSDILAELPKDWCLKAKQTEGLQECKFLQDDVLTAGTVRPPRSSSRP